MSHTLFTADDSLLLTSLLSTAEHLQQLRCKSETVFLMMSFPRSHCRHSVGC